MRKLLSFIILLLILGFFVMGQFGCNCLPFSTVVILIDEQWILNPGYYRLYQYDLEIGKRIDIYLTSSQPVRFYLFDEINYYRWLHYETYTAYLSEFNVTSYSKTYYLPKSQRYYFVVWNSNATLSSEYSLVVKYYK